MKIWVVEVRRDEADPWEFYDSFSDEERFKTFKKAVEQPGKHYFEFCYSLLEVEDHTRHIIEW